LHDTVGTWIAAGPLHIDLAFKLDGLSGLLCLIITFIGFLIHVYSSGYMEHDPDVARFFAYLNLFCGSMLVLVLGDSLPVMFIGWEGVGLCSYLLIGFWYKETPNADAGKKAFITNRIGDLGFLIGMFLLYQYAGTLNFQQIQDAATPGGALAQPLWLGGSIAFWAALFLFIGATGKSAQIPLYVWLPDAMAGPTPVSALIHAATMVTAGVYMIVRCSEIYVHAPAAMFVVAVIGAATALFAATIGLAQNDIKKVLAYSTISQLGYMFLACGVGAFAAAIFHVITHAFFKALLFLGSGSVIAGMHHEQDMRRMGGLKKYMPITFATMLTGWLAISGIPIFAGFFSKDEILWRTWSAPAFSLPSTGWAKFLWFIAALTAFLTAVYMTRMMVMTFWGKERFREQDESADSEPDHDHGPVEPHESPWLMTLPLIVLAVLSTIGGFIGVPYALSSAFTDRNVNVLEHTLEPAVATVPPGLHSEVGAVPVGEAHAPAPEPAPADTQTAHSHEEVTAERMLAGLSVLIGLLGIGIGWYMFQRRPLLQMPRLLENKYYVDEIYDAALIRPIEVTSREGLWKIFDMGVIDGGLHTIGEVVTELGRLGRYLSAGFVRAYAAIILLGALILIGLFAALGFPK